MANELSLLESEAIQEHLATIPGLPPLDSRESWIARGYADENSEPTKLGEDYLMLEDQGLFDPTGQLTAKGKAFAMTKDDLIDGDLDSFIIADKAGLLDDPEVTLAGAVEGVAGMLGGAVKSAASQGVNMLLAPFSKEAEDEFKLQQNATLMGAFKAQAQLGAGISRGIDKLWLEPDEDEAKYYDSKQSFMRSKRDIADMSAAGTVGAILGSAEVLQSMEEARQATIAQLGPEKAAAMEQNAEGLGAVALDPSNYASFGAGFFVSKAAQGPSLFAKLPLTIEKAAIAQAKATQAAGKAALAKSITNRAAQTMQATSARAAQLESIGDMAGAATVRQLGENAAARSATASGMFSRLDSAATESAAAAAVMTKKAGGAERILSAVEAVRQAKAIPFNVTAGALEYMGGLLTKGDEMLESGLKAAGLDDVGRKMAQNTAAVLGITVNPLMGIPALLAAGPVLTRVGNLSRVVGKEVLQARGSIPFWQRVAQNSSAGPVARSVGRLIDNATLGGKVLRPVGVAGNALKGAVAAYPVNVAFEALAEGGEINQNVLNRAAAGSLVFASTGAGFGALVNGNLAHKQRQMMGDEINFRNSLTPDQQRAFGALGKGSRRTIANYAAINPTMTIKLGKGGVSRYDYDSQTSYINTESGNSLRPLVTHEMLHHTLVKGQMEDGVSALLVGTPGTGGIFRKADGTLDPHFQKAMDVYNDRLAVDGITPRTPEQFAVEYFIESGVDHVLGMAESGKLSELAGRSTVERFVRGLVEETISRVPFIRDLSYKLGGATDHRGGLVQGNGLLADGIRELPEAKRMLNRMLKEQAGRTPPAVAKKRGSKKDGAGVELSIPMDSGAVDALFGTLKTDKDGNVIRDNDGNPFDLDRETYVRREALGATLREQAAKDIADGRAMPEGALKPSDKEKGSWVGTHLTPEQVKTIADSGVFNTKQMAMLRMLNRAAKTQTGESFAMIYQPALRTKPNGKKVYDSIPATFRELVPVGVKITKDGNLVFETMSVTQLMKNVNERAASKRGKDLYQGDVKAILADVQGVMDLHRAGLKTDNYFADKYGAGSGPERKNFINTVFGLMTTEQQKMNPLFMEDGIRGDTNPFKSRRVDRINQTTRLQGETKFFLGYEPIKGNWFPNGLPE